MSVNISSIQKGVASYLDNELMPKFPQNGIQKVIAGTAIALIIRNSTSQLEELLESKVVEMMGIVDDDEKIDVEMLKDEIKNHIPDSGFEVEVPMFGVMKFKKADIDRLYEHIVNA